MESGKVRLTLRLDPDVYQMVQSAVERSGQSLNEELNVRLRDSFVADAPVVLTTSEKALRAILREELGK